MSVYFVCGMCHFASGFVIKGFCGVGVILVFRDSTLLSVVA